MGKLDVDHREFSFVDYGSGKGRVLMLAAAYPFRRILGVEFSESLDRVARDNIATLGADAGRVETVVPRTRSTSTRRPGRSSSTSSTRSARRCWARCWSARAPGWRGIRGPPTSCSPARPSSRPLSTRPASSASTSTSSAGSRGASGRGGSGPRDELQRAARASFSAIRHSTILITSAAGNGFSTENWIVV